VDSAPTKDPERQRTGRLGALTVHARGRTNTGPARAAWESRLAAEFGIDDSLTDVERERRMASAVRVRMSQIARSRWTNKKAAREDQSPRAAEPVEGTRDAAPTD
jgi:hypothetical protein